MSTLDVSETLGGRREEEIWMWTGKGGCIMSQWRIKKQGLGWSGSSLLLNNDEYLLHTAAVVAKDFTLLAQVLGVLLTLVRHIQAIWLL